jgi:hypothetical protein
MSIPGRVNVEHGIITIGKVEGEHKVRRRK